MPFPRTSGSVSDPIRTAPHPLAVVLACREADRKAGFLLKNTRFSTEPTTGQKLFSAR